MTPAEVERLLHSAEKQRGRLIGTCLRLTPWQVISLCVLALEALAKRGEDGV